MSLLQMLTVFAVLTASGYPLAAGLLRLRPVGKRLLMCLPLGAAFTTLALQLAARMGAGLSRLSVIWAAVAVASALAAWARGRRSDSVRTREHEWLPVAAATVLVIALGI